MRDRLLVLATLSFVVAVAGASVTSQTSTWVQQRTPWGDPDLQGIWTNEDSRTPRQRPAKYGDRECLTDEEVAELEAQALGRYEQALADADPAGPRSRADVERTQGTVEAGIYGA